MPRVLLRRVLLEKGERGRWDRRELEERWRGRRDLERAKELAVKREKKKWRVGSVRGRISKEERG